MLLAGIIFALVLDSVSILASRSTASWVETADIRGGDVLRQADVWSSLHGVCRASLELYASAAVRAHLAEGMSTESIFITRADSALSDFSTHKCHMRAFLPTRFAAADYAKQWRGDQAALRAKAAAGGAL